MHIRTLSMKPVVIEVKVKTSDTGTARMEIWDGATVIKNLSAEASNHEAVMQVELDQAQLWSCEGPNLWAKFADDVVQKHVGIRLLQWTPEHGLTIKCGFSRSTRGR